MHTTQKKHNEQRKPLKFKFETLNVQKPYN